MKHLSRSVFIPTLLLALLSGCTSIESVKEFGKATAVATTAATQGYQDYVRTSTDAKREGLLAINGFITNDDLIKPFEASATDSAIVDALDQLGKYAKALEALATKDATSDIKAAAGDLKGSLTDLNSSLQGMGKGAAFSETDISTISGVVAALGSVYVQHLQEQALRTIILQADSGVQKVTRTLAGVLPKLGKDLKLAMTNAQADFVSSIKINKDKLTLKEKQELGRQAQIYHDSAVSAEANYKAMADLLKKVGVAHAKLATAASQKKLTAKEAYAAVLEVVTRAEDVKKLFEEVKQAK